MTRNLFPEHPSHATRNAHEHRYHDAGPILPLCVNAQRYYERHSYQTRVKAAGLLSVDEAMQLAGVASLTVAPALLHLLADTKESQEEVTPRSLFKEKATAEEAEMEYKSFINDETKFREAFARRENGNGQVKTKQVQAL